MHHSGPLPLTFEGPVQGSVSKNCQNASQGNPVYNKVIFCPMRLFQLYPKFNHSYGTTSDPVLPIVLHFH